MNKQTSLFMLLLSFCCTPLPTQVLIPSDKGSSVKFKIRNFGFSVEGSFTHIKGSIHFNPARLAESDFRVSVDAATVNTDNNSRDKHLQKPEYFDAAVYPEILFTSEKIGKSSEINGYIVVGKFMVKGKVKACSIPFTATWRDGGWLFAGSVVLNRRDFGVGGSSLVLSDTLILVINLFALQ